VNKSLLGPGSASSVNMTEFNAKKGNSYKCTDITSIKLDDLVTIEVSNYHAQPFLTKDNQNLDKRLNKFLLLLLLLFILMF